MFDNYCCIKCKGGLEVYADFVKCSNCKIKYPISEGVLIFTKDSPKFKSGNPSLDKLLKQLVFFSKTEGCINALRRLADAKFGLFDYVTDLGRVDFKYLLPLTKESNILDVGAGLGLISLSLAKTAKDVYVLEKVLENCKFIYLRARQEGINNISIACGGKEGILPYRNNIFDIVILNGVFEWLGFETTYSNVKMVQKRLLQEVYRVLKKEGIFYITTQNRYSLELNISKNAHNNGIRGILFLPDNLINWFSKKFKGKEYLSGLLSVSKYLDFFKEVDFYAKKIWVPLPNSRYPDEVFDYNARHCRFQRRSPSYHSRRLYRFFTFLLPWSAKKNLCLSHIFLLAKHKNRKQTTPSIIEAIINQEPILQGAELISFISGAGSSLTSSTVVHLRKNNTRFVCKIARFEELPFLEREYRNLKKIKSLGLKHSYLLPEIIIHGKVQGFNYSLLPFYKSYRLYNRNLIQKIIMSEFIGNKLLSQTFNFLIDLALKTKRNNSLSFGDYVEKPILNFLKATADTQLHNLGHRYLESLQKEWPRVPLVYTHTDLSIHNFIIEKLAPVKFKIVDWEGMEEEGLPLVDLIRICRVMYANKNAREDLLRTYCLKLNLSKSIMPALVFLNVIRMRKKLIIDGHAHLLPRWQKREKIILNEIYPTRIVKSDIKR